MTVERQKMSDYHIPVLLHESIDALVIDKDGIYIDVTFGGGGHAREILNRLSAKGRLIAFDQDGDAEKNIIADKRLTLLQANFRHLYRYWKWLDIAKVDGLLCDFGVSSYQFDTQERGFSHRFDSDLDMRMNSGATLTASHILNSYHESDLVKLFSEYGEIRNSKKLASAVLARRQRRIGLDDTRALNQLLDEVLVGERHKYFAQVYQALRIEVNDEIGALKQMLTDSVRVMKQGGRIVGLSYHSLEDRIMKRFLKTGSVDGKLVKDEYGRSVSQVKMLGKLIMPSAEEQLLNSRSRSAKMRVGEKL